MNVRGIPAPSRYLPATYWEDRARRFAAEGEGLAAVCSYGMPRFYNRVIDYCQWLALRQWIDVPAGTRVLDVGCGVGRWSRRLAARGAKVTGIDISPTMIAEAKRRAAAEGIADRCRFSTENLADFFTAATFDLVLGVTVLQHIIDPRALRAAVLRMTDHLAPGGRMVLLEAAPMQLANHCDSSIFRARTRHEYVALFADCGLKVRAITGVDPAPFKHRLLPRLKQLSRPMALTATLAASLLSLPIDALFGRRAANRSWHAVFVLERDGSARRTHA
ncbi:MAG: class I SAM-dependent methyltransferase [Gammaproteobacteria bacterium]